MRPPTFILCLVIFLSRLKGVRGDPHGDEGQKDGHAMGVPNVFAVPRGKLIPCHENGVVASWCDVHIDLPNMECLLSPELDAYGCACVGTPALCPDECVDGTPPVEKTKSGISCRGIPHDEPNYVLREAHPLNRCENNAVVASWCDEYVNPHVECGLAIAVDEYYCRCSGKVVNCPTECVAGVEPIEKTHGIVRCKGIPLDQPNYIILEE